MYSCSRDTILGVINGGRSYWRKAYYALQRAGLSDELLVRICEELEPNPPIGPFDELGLGSGLVLKDLGLTTAGALQVITEQDFVALHNVGMSRQTRVEIELRKHGLRFRDLDEDFTERVKGVYGRDRLGDAPTSTLLIGLDQGCAATLRHIIKSNGWDTIGKLQSVPPSQLQHSLLGSDNRQELREAVTTLLAKLSTFNL